MPQVYVYSPLDRARYNAEPSAAVGEGWYHTQLAVRKKDLIRQIALILVVPKARPGVLAIASIARLEYDVAAKQANKLSRMGIAIDHDAKKELTNLIVLDPSFNRYNHPSTATATATSPTTNTPGPTLR
jgi:hypothetical protein